MQEGLLWFDNNPERKLGEKIKQAADRYQAKFGRKPTVCYLNTTMFESNQANINGIELKPAKNVRPHHLWIGVDEVRTNLTPKAA